MISRAVALLVSCHRQLFQGKAGWLGDFEAGVEQLDLDIWEGQGVAPQTNLQTSGPPLSVDARGFFVAHQSPHGDLWHSSCSSGPSPRLEKWTCGAGVPSKPAAQGSQCWASGSKCHCCHLCPAPTGVRLGMSCAAVPPPSLQGDTSAMLAKSEGLP